MFLIVISKISIKWNALGIFKVLKLKNDRLKIGLFVTKFTKNNLLVPILTIYSNGAINITSLFVLILFHSFMKKS